MNRSEARESSETRAGKAVKVYFDALREPLIPVPKVPPPEVPLYRLGGPFEDAAEEIHELFAGLVVDDRDLTTLGLDSFVDELPERRIRSNLRRAPGDLTDAEWRDILTEFGGACAYCQSRGLDLELEHVIPVSQGGLTTASNVVPACGSCNSSKGGKRLEEWMTEERLRRFLERWPHGHAYTVGAP